MKKSNPMTILNEVNRINEIIDNGSKDEFITFAKSYNIFQVSNSKFYTDTCVKIKERLKRENLSEDILRT